MADMSILAGGCKKKPHANPTNYQFEVLKRKALIKPILPKKYSIKDGFPKVYRQIYGNCTSNAVLACDDYYYHGPNTDWVPSTVFTYYNQKKRDGSPMNLDEGSNVECGLDVVRKFGACSAKSWPNDKPFNMKPSEAAYKNGLLGHEITSYYAVKNLTQVREAISTGYPVAGAFGWIKSSVDANCVLKPSSKAEFDKCFNGHAIVIVGYDDEKQLFEFRNSWGETWGNKGYAYMTYKQFNLAAWWEDIYAVVR